MFTLWRCVNRRVNNVVVDAAGISFTGYADGYSAFANRVMGHVGQYWLGDMGLLLAGCATINTLMAAVPRIIYGMWTALCRGF